MPREPDVSRTSRARCREQIKLERKMAEGFWARID